MSFASAELPYIPRMGTMPRDLSHDLRTPLTVIRMQAQLLLRAAKRDSFSPETSDRERIVLGLQRIDDAVSRLSIVLDRAEGTVSNDSFPASRRADGCPPHDVH